MFTTVNHTSPIVAGIIAIFALSIAGIIFRIMFIRRMRAAAYANNAFQTPLRQTIPLSQPPPPRFNPPPPNNFNPSPNWNRNNTHNNWNQPPPPYPQPAFQPRGTPRTTSPPTSPRAAPGPRRFNPPSLPPPSAVPDAANPTRPSAPSNPSPASPPSPPSNPSPPSPPSPPSLPSVPAQPARLDSSSMTLVDRMREVQNLMLQIHNLESQPTSQTNRTKIQELQKRVTELSDVETPQEVPSGPAPAPGRGSASVPVLEDGRSVAHDSTSRQEPPPYGLDGRDD